MLCVRGAISRQLARALRASTATRKKGATSVDASLLLLLSRAGRVSPTTTAPMPMSCRRSQVAGEEGSGGDACNGTPTHRRVEALGVRGAAAAYR